MGQLRVGLALDANWAPWRDRPRFRNRSSGTDKFGFANNHPFSHLRDGVGSDSPPQLLQRVERARRVVSLCSQAIIRAYDEEALLLEECRILIDVGGYVMAWVGEAKPGEAALLPL